jgi:hypothetical protein
MRNPVALLPSSERPIKKNGMTAIADSPAQNNASARRRFKPPLLRGRSISLIGFSLSVVVPTVLISSLCLFANDGRNANIARDAPAKSASSRARFSELNQAIQRDEFGAGQQRRDNGHDKMILRAVGAFNLSDHEYEASICSIYPDCDFIKYRALPLKAVFISGNAQRRGVCSAG